MPELPEVETISKQIYEEVCGLRVQMIKFNRLDYLINSKEEQICKTLERQVLSDVSRRGKYIVMTFQTGLLVTHLGMTGNYIVSSDRVEKVENTVKSYMSTHSSMHQPEISDKHLIYNIMFAGKQLKLTDIRRFGKLYFFNSDAEWKNSDIYKKLGVEPLSDSFTAKYLYEKCLKKQISIKALLLDQTIISGIGNIYANEALFISKISPMSIASSLTLKHHESLVNSLKEVLTLAITFNGTSFSDFLNIKGNKGGFQDLLKVYGKENMPCPSCKRKISKEMIAGRSTFFCSKCQKMV